MHQLQWGICSNQTEGSPRHLFFKCLAARASPHYGMAILCHHGPPEPLLSESQGPLLALMPGIMMHPVKCQAALTHGNEGQHSVCLAFWGHVYIHETLVQDETVTNMEERLPCSVSASAPRHSLRRVSCWSGSMPFLSQSHLQHLARATSAAWACSQSTMCIGSSFAA